MDLKIEGTIRLKVLFLRLPTTVDNRVLEIDTQRLRPSQQLKPCIFRDRPFWLPVGDEEEEGEVLMDFL